MAALTHMLKYARELTFWKRFLQRVRCRNIWATRSRQLPNSVPGRSGPDHLQLSISPASGEDPGFSIRRIRFLSYTADAFTRSCADWPVDLRVFEAHIPFPA